MKKILSVLIIVICFQQLKAQYTEIINSKRPGLSESPYSIGTNVYQFESGFFYRNSNNKDFGARPESYGGELFFRHGRFSEKLEINAFIAYQKDELLNTMGPNYQIKGISALTIGAKYLIYQQEFTDKSKEIRSWKRRVAFDKKRLIPSVGVYAGLNTNFVGEDFKADGMSYKAAVLLQNDFTDRLVLLTNLFADKLTAEDEFYSYIVTLTYAINQNWSFFAENQGSFKDKFAPTYQFGAGLAYLISPDLQVDASARTNFFDNYSYAVVSAGFSYRLDRHQDSFVYKNAPTPKRVKKPKKKGFFGRLFNKKRN